MAGGQAGQRWMLLASVFVVLQLAALAAAGNPAPLASGQCGPNKRPCRGNLCCSEYGYCGSTDDYCGEGCQGGPCTSGGGEMTSTTGKAATLMARQCYRNVACRGGYCSRFGYCIGGGDINRTTPKAAVIKAQCGRQNGNKACPDGFCCNQHGYCGSIDDYCAGGCQSGPCFGSKSASPARSTSSGKASFYNAPYVPMTCYDNDQGQLPKNMHFAAGGDSSGANIWNNGKNCGKFFKIQCVGKGCRGSEAIIVKIVDRCPNGCMGGRAFDLSSQAFAAIADPSFGDITVKYSPV